MNEIHWGTVVRNIFLNVKCPHIFMYGVCTLFGSIFMAIRWKPSTFCGVTLHPFKFSPWTLLPHVFPISLVTWHIFVKKISHIIFLL